MKNKITLAMIVAILALLITVCIQSSIVKKVRAEVKVERNNIAVLLRDARTYRIKDSMNVAEVEALELKVRDFEEYCKKQEEIIKSLKINKKELESVVSSQLESIYKLSGQTKDTVVTYVDRIQRDTISRVAYSDKWIDLDILIKKDGSFDGNIEASDNLHVVETVTYKRFLGFLWRTAKVDKRMVKVVSESPYTAIKDVSYVEIRK